MFVQFSSTQAHIQALSTRHVFIVRKAHLPLVVPNNVPQGYLITLVNGKELVARVARRFMPRLKTESEIATMHYLRERTAIPVPEVYHYDSNPYNRLGGEYILMSKVTTKFALPLGPGAFSEYATRD